MTESWLRVGSSPSLDSSSKIESESAKKCRARVESIPSLDSDPSLLQIPKLSTYTTELKCYNVNSLRGLLAIISNLWNKSTIFLFNCNDGRPNCNLSRNDTFLIFDLDSVSGQTELVWFGFSRIAKFGNVYFSIAILTYANFRPWSCKLIMANY